MKKLKIKLLNDTAKIPVRAFYDDAGADLFYNGETKGLYPGERDLFEIGIALEIPYGYVGLVHPRSGLSSKKGVTVINAPGTIDAGYRGEVKVALINLSDQWVEVEHGERIAQLLIQRVELVEFEEVDELEDSSRATGGFGSTGMITLDRTHTPKSVEEGYDDSKNEDHIGINFTQEEINDFKPLSEYIAKQVKKALSEDWWRANGN